MTKKGSNKNNPNTEQINRTLLEEGQVQRLENEELTLLIECFEEKIDITERYERDLFMQYYAVYDAIALNYKEDHISIYVQLASCDGFGNGQGEYSTHEWNKLFDNWRKIYIQKNDRDRKDAFRVLKSRQLNSVLVLDAYNNQIDLLEGKMSGEEFISQNQAKLTQIAHRYVQNQERTMSDDIKDFKEYFNKDVSELAFKTGFKEFDEYTGGLKRGEVTILGGKSSMGKTSFALTLLKNICQNNNLSCLFFSLDIGTRMLIAKLISLEGSFSVSQIVGHYQTIEAKGDSDSFLLREQLMGVGRYNLRIMDNVKDMSEIEKECRIKKPDLVFVDYIQTIKCDDTVGREGIKDAMVRFKNVARDSDCCVVLLAQMLTKGSSTVKFTTPHNNEIKDCADIEHLADMILLLNRHTYYKDRSPEMEGIDHHKADNNIAELLITKNRYGGLKTFDVEFIGKYGLFKDVGGSEF